MRDSSFPGRPVSVWHDGADGGPRASLNRDLEVDVAIVGAGIVGLSTALALQQGGARVAVVEGRGVAAGVSGNTTAKLSSLQGLSYDSLVSKHGTEVAADYAAANEAGIDLVEQTVAKLAIECDFRRAPNSTYTEDPASRDEIESEFEAARAAGLAVELASELPELPYEIAAAVTLENQAAFDPVRYLEAIAAHLDRDEQTVFENSMADAAGSGRVRLAGRNEVRAEQIVIATQIPFADRGLFFARMDVERSYALTARTPTRLPSGLYLSSDQPSISLRTVRWRDEELLMIGGAGHPLGEGNPSESVATLERLAIEKFSATSFEHRWSAHDFLAADGLPYIGGLTPTSKNPILVATGLRKWGLAMGTTAATILADRILGNENRWAERFDPWRRPRSSDLPTLAKHNAKSGVRFVGDRLKRGSDSSGLARGEGKIVGDGLTQKAVCRDDAGNLHSVSARCTHLGCLVEWNAPERTWDCPCHGSRFAPSGEVLNGPATNPLAPRE